MQDTTDIDSDALPEGIVLPLLKYGFRSTPATWEELKAIVKEGELSKLSRSRRQQIDYEVYKRELLFSWKSIYDYVLCDKLKFPAVIDPSSGRKQACLPTERTISKALVPNDFPYFMEANIEHWILWKYGEDCSVQDREEAEQHLQNKLRGVRDFIHWVNPPNLQSLPEIDHVHILVLRR